MVQSVWKRSLAVPRKGKHRVPVGSARTHYKPKETENIRPHKNLYTNVHSSITHNSPQKSCSSVHKLMDQSITCGVYI